MNRHDEIMKRGAYIYEMYARRNGYTCSNRFFADAFSKTPAAYILAEQRFTTGHDDTAGFVELIDENEKIILSWEFDYPMTKRFSNPDYYDDDCLVYYLKERFHLPTVGYCEPE